MKITEEQYAKIKDGRSVQRGNVSMSNLTVLNAILYVAEQGCKWRGLPQRFGNEQNTCPRRIAPLGGVLGQVP